MAVPAKGYLPGILRFSRFGIPEKLQSYLVLRLTETLGVYLDNTINSAYAISFDAHVISRVQLS